MISTIIHETTAACQAPRFENDFVRVPNHWLGQLLDQGKASIYALHLYALKLSKGPGFTLNETHVRRHCAIGERAFRSGLGLMRASGLLTRQQVGRRSYATEAFAADRESHRHYVRLEAALLSESPQVVAFILAARLSPRWQSPAEVAKRIGITSTVTTRNIVRRVKEIGALRVEMTGRGGIVVARADVDCDPVKNVATKNVVAKNVATHSTKEEDSQNEGRFTGRRKKHTIGTSACADVPHEVQAPVWASLADWKQSGAVQMHGVEDYGSPTERADIDFWRCWIDAMGRVPGNLREPFALRQASEIAHVLVCMDKEAGGHLDFFSALIGVARRICEAAAAGRKIRSLGFVAAGLIRCVLNGDLDWAYARESPTLGENLGGWRAFAERHAATLEARGARIDRERLLSTGQIEHLAELLQAYGDVAVVHEFNSREFPGKIVLGWAAFEPEQSRAAARNGGR